MSAGESDGGLNPVADVLVAAERLACVLAVEKDGARLDAASVDVLFGVKM